MTNKRKTLAGIIGSIVGAALLFVAIPAEESGRTVDAKVATDGAVTLRHIAGPQYLKAYLDIVQVPTACDGITKGVRIGMRFTEAQCAAKLEDALIVHAEGVIACVPGLYGRPNQAAAAVSLAYNIGVAGFCRSTAARRFKAGQWRAGCDAFAMWNRAGGRVVPGLVNRRKRERAMCITGLAA